VFCSESFQDQSDASISFKEDSVAENYSRLVQQEYLKGGKQLSQWFYTIKKFWKVALGLWIDCTSSYILVNDEVPAIDRNLVSIWQGYGAQVCGQALTQMLQCWYFIDAIDI
jgi:hypothetical protein